MGSGDGEGEGPLLIPFDVVITDLGSNVNCSQYEAVPDGLVSGQRGGVAILGVAFAVIVTLLLLLLLCVVVAAVCFVVVAVVTIVVVVFAMDLDPLRVLHTFHYQYVSLFSPAPCSLTPSSLGTSCPPGLVLAPPQVLTVREMGPSNVAQ